ncbi:hypothetical protein JAAARDRAFT_61200 [Jaapia argillacea MUCL 33604]|uniref:Uncharacterized protein n=1 Tax=Jaapia argillacea MUCL 33604 TaxID=933084 RepID=A0A067PT21_9AGAM|nr:hypothetical protein JAAARDRAFT_61200 [Jaapia argillacea MUCL 33604]
MSPTAFHGLSKRSTSSQAPIIAGVVLAVLGTGIILWVAWTAIAPWCRRRRSSQRPTQGRQESLFHNNVDEKTQGFLDGSRRGFPNTNNGTLERQGSKSYWGSVRSGQGYTLVEGGHEEVGIEVHDRAAPSNLHHPSVSPPPIRPNHTREAALAHLATKTDPISALPTPAHSFGAPLAKPTSGHIAPKRPPTSGSRSGSALQRLKSSVASLHRSNSDASVYSVASAAPSLAQRMLEGDLPPIPMPWRRDPSQPSHDQDQTQHPRNASYPYARPDLSLSIPGQNSQATGGARPTGHHKRATSRSQYNGSNMYTIPEYNSEPPLPLRPLPAPQTQQPSQPPQQRGRALPNPHSPSLNSSNPSASFSEAGRAITTTDVNSNTNQSTLPPTGTSPPQLEVPIIAPLVVRWPKRDPSSSQSDTSHHDTSSSPPQPDASSSSMLTPYAYADGLVRSITAIFPRYVTPPTDGEAPPPPVPRRSPRRSGGISSPPRSEVGSGVEVV